MQCMFQVDWKDVKALHNRSDVSQHTVFLTTVSNAQLAEHEIEARCVSVLVDASSTCSEAPSPVWTAVLNSDGEAKLQVIPPTTLGDAHSLLTLGATVGARHFAMCRTRVLARYRHRMSAPLCCSRSPWSTLHVACAPQTCLNRVCLSMIRVTTRGRGQCS